MKTRLRCKVGIHKWKPLSEETTHHSYFCECCVVTKFKFNTKTKHLIFMTNMLKHDFITIMEGCQESTKFSICLKDLKNVSCKDNCSRYKPCKEFIKKLGLEKEILLDKEIKNDGMLLDDY